LKNPGLGRIVSASQGRHYGSSGSGYSRLLVAHHGGKALNVSGASVESARVGRTVRRHACIVVRNSAADIPIVFPNIGRFQTSTLGFMG
jgi:hypothetical protein